MNIMIVKTLIEDELKREIEHDLDEAKKNAIAVFDKRKGEIVAGIMVQIMKTVDIQLSADRLIITIKSDEK